MIHRTGTGARFIAQPVSIDTDGNEHPEPTTLDTPLTADPETLAPGLIDVVDTIVTLIEVTALHNGGTPINPDVADDIQRDYLDAIGDAATQSEADFLIATGRHLHARRHAARIALDSGQSFYAFAMGADDSPDNTGPLADIRTLIDHDQDWPVAATTVADIMGYLSRSSWGTSPETITMFATAWDAYEQLVLAPLMAAMGQQTMRVEYGVVIRWPGGHEEIPTDLDAVDRYRCERFANHFNLGLTRDSVRGRAVLRCRASEVGGWVDVQ